MARIGARLDNSEEQRSSNVIQIVAMFMSWKTQEKNIVGMLNKVASHRL